MVGRSNYSSWLFNNKCNQFQKRNITLFIVITIVFIVVGDALKAILHKREQTILVNIQEAETRSQEARIQLQMAQQKWQEATQKVQQIEQENKGAVQLEIDKYEQQTITDIDRLHQLKHETILAQQRKVTKQVFKHIIHSIFERVDKKLEAKCENAQFQKKVTNFYINLFRKYKT